MNGIGPGHEKGAGHLCPAPCMFEAGHTPIPQKKTTRRTGGRESRGSMPYWPAPAPTQGLCQGSADRRHLPGSVLQKHVCYHCESREAGQNDDGRGDDGDNRHTASPLPRRTYLPRFRIEFTHRETPFIVTPPPSDSVRGGCLGWGRRIRTSTYGFRVRCPAIRRAPRDASPGFKQGIFYHDSLSWQP